LLALGACLPILPRVVLRSHRLHAYTYFAIALVYAFGTAFSVALPLLHLPASQFRLLHFSIAGLFLLAAAVCFRLAFYRLRPAL
jgi:hypothetical protein